MTATNVKATSVTITNASAGTYVAPAGSTAAYVPITTTNTVGASAQGSVTTAGYIPVSTATATTNSTTGLTATVNIAAFDGTYTVETIK